MRAASTGIAYGYCRIPCHLLTLWPIIIPGLAGTGRLGRVAKLRNCW